MAMGINIGIGIGMPMRMRMRMTMRMRMRMRMRMGVGIGMGWRWGMAGHTTPVVHSLAPFVDVRYANTTIWQELYGSSSSHILHLAINRGAGSRCWALELVWAL